MIFACVTFIAASVLLFITLPTAYWIEAITLNPTDLTAFGSILGDADEIINHTEKLVYSYLTLTITAIFAVKLTFIIFFRPMVDKMPFMIKYWKTLLAITLISFAFSASSTFIECPYFGLKGRKFLLMLAVFAVLNQTQVCRCLMEKVTVTCTKTISLSSRIPVPTSIRTCQAIYSSNLQLSKHVINLNPLK